MKKLIENSKKALNITEKVQEYKENRIKIKEISKLINQWKEIMAQTNTYNQVFLTFTLSHINRENYGFSFRVYCPYGLSFNILENLKPTIENNLSCIFLYNQKKVQNFVMAKIILNGFGGKDIIYEPPKINPYEIYIGKNIDGTDAIISSKDISHFLLSGSNGSGKSRMLDCMIATLITNCTEQQLELYLVQVSKNDLIIYEDTIQCRAFCEDLNKTEIMLNHIIEKMRERDKLIRPMRKDFKGSNITDYNKLHPQNQLSICWIIFDEMASLMNKNGNGDCIKKQKDKIIAMVDEIARTGRALGVFLGCCLQRPKIDSLSSDTKSQLNLRISFSQNNEKSSEIATDNGKIAVGLDERVAVYSCRGSGYDFVKTPYIDDKIIKQYIISKCKRGHRTLFSELEKLKKEPLQNIKPITTQPNNPNSNNTNSNNTNNNNNNSQSLGTAQLPSLSQIKPNTKKNNPNNNNPKPIDYSKVDPDVILKKQEQMQNNIKNIPNFVPYISPEKLNLIITDKTNLAFLPSSKPLKSIPK